MDYLVSRELDKSIVEQNVHHGHKVKDVRELPGCYFPGNTAVS